MKTTLDVALSDRAVSVQFDRSLEIDSTFSGLVLSRTARAPRA
ncbi:MAG: hypothetical protein R3F14_42295 [Polyangiaceae bacterium]